MPDLDGLGLRRRAEEPGRSSVPAYEAPCSTSAFPSPERTERRRPWWRVPVSPTPRRRDSRTCP